MKVFAIVALSVVGAITLAMLVYLLLALISFKLALSRKSTVKRVVNKTMAKTFASYKIDFCWWDKVKFDKIHLTARDGTKLVGHYYDSHSDNLAIVVHGYGADYREMQQYCRYFVEKSYCVLSVENRTHGESEGKFIGMGWTDRLDIVDWIKFMLEKNPNFKIVLMGLSMGASTVCMASGERLPSNVKGVISDCGYANAYDEFKYVFTSRAHLPSWPLLNILNSYMKMTYNYDLKQADAVKQIQKSSLPFLFIHGSADTFVPAKNVELLSSAVPDERKTVMVVEGAEHAMSYATDPQKYERALTKFLSKII